MKRLAFVLVLFACATVEAGGWVSVPPGFAGSLLGVSFAGGPGVAYAVGASGRMQKSTDGGLSSTAVGSTLETTPESCMPSTRRAQWSLPLGDGAIKGFPFPKFGDNILFVSTNDNVWAVVDNGTTGAVVPGWPVSITSPSFPLRPPDTPHVLVGSGNGRLYQIDISSPGTPSSVVLGLGNAAVGAPTLDLINSMIYVGTEAGITYAVSYPLP